MDGDYSDDEKWKENELLIGALSKPFPHTAAWNDLTGEPELTDDEDAFERADEAFNGRYWNAANVNGAIPICHEGCAYRDWLVVTGLEAGRMWHDARTTRAGLYPISIGKKKRVTFLDWYLDWLNEAVGKLPKSRRPT